MARIRRAVGLLLLLCTLACGGGGFGSPLGVGRTSPEGLDLSAAAARQLALQADAEDLQSRFLALQRRGGWRQRGFFSAAEHDEVEWLLFQFVTNHQAFWGEIDRLGGVELVLVEDRARPEAHLLTLHAGLALSDSAAFLVSTFEGDEVAVAKLNEAFYRTEIPARTYDRLGLAVTGRDRRGALASAWKLHQQELANPESPLAALSEDAALGSVLAALPALQARGAERLAAVDADQLPLAPEIEHRPAVAVGRRSARALGAFGYETRSLVFKDVSRVKSPTAQRIHFSGDQKRELHALLRPGDLILTYTAGYVSSVFIPGQFKHGITYVGSVDERRAAGLTPDHVPALAKPRAERFAQDVARDRMPDGSPADLIEAVAEGVKFSNLEQILDTHINRLVVLRPVLDPEERADFLAGVFAYLGDPYDFRFDFADATRQVCTEVIYRALDGKGGIAFTLVPRGGHPTLSADDVALLHLSKPGHFETIAFAEEDPDRDDHAARLQVGAAAELSLSQQMQSE